MNIGLHDSDSTGFPNLALMKLSAWHKAQGDTVEWWNPLLPYDRVYSSKVFTFTPECPYLPENTIRGGHRIWYIRRTPARSRCNVSRLQSLSEV